MNTQEQEQTQQNLQKLLEMHWLHCQHLESERAQFMQVYAAIIAGMAAGFGYLISTTSLGTDHLVQYVLLFLMALTLVGLFLTLRWDYAFECHRKRVNAIAGIMWFNCSLPLSTDPTMNIPPLRAMPGRLRRVDGALKTRYLFPLFYLCVLIGIVIVALVTRSPEGYRPIGWYLPLAYPAVLAFSMFFTHTVFRSIAALATEKRVVLAGCNGEWSQKHYLPFLIERASSGDITLWATDIQPEIKLDSPGSHSAWQAAMRKGSACYMDMTRRMESWRIPSNVDYVFVVTPDVSHCDTAEFWLARLSKTGKIFIEKPLDASVSRAAQLDAKKGSNSPIYAFDHYLASLHPLLHSGLRRRFGVADIESLNISILENEGVPSHRARTLKEGVVLDLFSHVLAASAAVAEKKSAPSEDMLQTVAMTKRELARYTGWQSPSETWARMEFLVGRTRCTAEVGKGVGNTPKKRMEVNGTAGMRIEIDFQARSVYVNDEQVEPLDSDPVLSFLEAVLKGNPAHCVPGVISFGAALEILRQLSLIRNTTRIGSLYHVGAYPA